MIKLLLICKNLIEQLLIYLYNLKFFKNYYLFKISENKFHFKTLKSVKLKKINRVNLLFGLNFNIKIERIKCHRPENKQF